MPKRKIEQPVEKQTRFIRLPEILARYPVSTSSWWRGVKNGTHPQPVKLSANITAWLESDFEAFLESKAQAKNKSK